MALGIVEGSIVQTPSGVQQLNPQAFRGPALQKGQNAARAGAAIAGLAQDVTDKIQENRTARRVFEADLAMRKTYDDFTASLAQNPDEGTWLPAWKEQTQQLRDKILDSPHVGPDLARMLSQKMDTWQEATTSTVNIAALNKGVQHSRDIALADSTYAANTGHVDGPGGANTIMDAAVDNHAFSKEEADVIKKKFPVMAAKAQTDQFILRYPTTDEANLTKAPFYKTLPPSEQKAAVNALYKAKLETWKSNAEDMLTTKIDSTTGQIPEAAIKQAIDTRKIDPQFGENLIAAQKRENEKDDEGQYKYVSALAHDPVAWRADHPEEYAHQLMQEAANIKSPTVRQRAIDDINRELDSVHKEGFTSDGPLVRSEMEMMKQNHEALYGAAPVPGRRAGQTVYQGGGADKVREMSDADFREKFGPKAKREDIVAKIGSYQEAENKAYIDRQAKFLQVVHDNPEKAKDPEWLTQQREDIERPHVEAKVKQALGGGTQFQKGEVRSQGGKQYKYDGTQWDEVK